MKLNRRTLAPLHCASKDPTRYNLNGLHFDAVGMTVGTNGHILAVVRPEPLEPHKRSFSVEASWLKEAVRATRPKRAPDVELTDAYPEMNVEYPNWRQIHDNPPVAHHAVTLSLHVLEALVATARQFAGGKKGDENMRLNFRFPKDPWRAIRVEHDGLEFSVMPVRRPK